MKIKRLLSGVIAGVMGVTMLLSGCGGGKTVSDEKPYVIDWYSYTAHKYLNRNFYSPAL